MGAERFEGRRGHATVEEAATAGTPARYVRILAVRVVEDHAAVLVQENEPPVVIEDLTVLERAGGVWYPISQGGVGHGSETWSSTDLDNDDPDREDLGIGCAVYQLPAGVDGAVVKSGAWTDRLEPSPSGWALVLRWPVTCADWQPTLILDPDESPAG